MTRLAAGRDTHLVPEEIAVEALRQFDAGKEPSIRGLAAALKVKPSAIYHHFESRDAIVQAAVDLVWEEVTVEFRGLVGAPLTDPPVDVLVASGIATRRVFGRHHRIAPHMAGVPASTELQSATLAMLGRMFERMGLDAGGAADAFHAFSSFTVGASLFAAIRRIATEDADDRHQVGRYRSLDTPGAQFLASADVRAALDDMVDISAADPARDEAMFAAGLRRLMQTFDGSDDASNAARG